MLDILSFRKMISPTILQLLFWAAVVGNLYGVYVLLRLEHWAWPLALIFGLLVIRVVFERAILAFRTHDRLGEIASLLADKKDP